MEKIYRFALLSFLTPISRLLQTLRSSVSLEANSAQARRYREVAGAERAQHERELEGGRAGLKQAAAQLAKLRKGTPGVVADAAAQLASGATVAAAEADRRLGREIQVRAG
jgi:hypothetical protein